MRKYGLSVVLIVVLVVVLGWGIYQCKEKNDYHTYLDIHFQRQFYELIGHVENAQVNLSKAMISASNKDIAQFLNNTINQSYMAQEKLTQLPFHHGGIRDTERFLNQLGDYCTAMANKSLNGTALDEKELHTMTELLDYANHLSEQLTELQQQIVAGGVNFGDLRREGNKNLRHVEEQMKSFSLINFEERMQEYPKLIYDGPFSDHLKDMKPRLAGRKISEEEAVNIISDSFEKHRHSNIKVIGDTENQPIDSYYISISNENTPAGYEATAAISKIGGEIIWYMDPVLSSENNINKKDAIKKAGDFLKRIGFNNMEATYSMEDEGQMVINFAYKQENVLIYSDLVKVKLALDDGDIIGLEAQGFLTNHYERNIEEPKISKEEAGKMLSDRVEEENVRLAIIPIAGGKEVLTYEFKVKFGGDYYLIYIDADTGQQRKVLLMVNQENGTLVI
ncbi:MAG: germination protein YpeB [Natronincolaceae bacterium]|jgi:spore germination protein|nr:germination protein YpeB [Bacillota bacterium]